MKENQFNKYSQFYDSLYQIKDYPAEVRFIDQVIKKYSKTKTKSIISLGCGTCSHDILLAKKGYSILGVDQSESMLQIARKKIKENSLESKISLLNSNVTEMKVDEIYDTAMAMFNVIGYQTTNDEINKALENTNRALKEKGLFFFDCWFTPAVISDKPTDRIREIKGTSSKTIRLTQSKLNYEKNTIDINFHVLEIKKQKIINEAIETHTMRHWSIPEIENILNVNGFDLLKVCNFMDLNSVPSVNEWNIFVVAQKR